MPYKDPEVRKAKQREYQAKHYLKNKEYYKKKAREHQKNISLELQALKAQTPCADCGIQYPSYVMDFDHLGEVEKLFHPSRGGRYGRNKAMAEVAKCEIVCSNCHRIRTHNRSSVGEPVVPVSLIS